MTTKHKLIIWHALVVLLALVFWTYVAGIINQPADSFELGLESIVYLVVFASAIALGLVMFPKKWIVLSFTASAGIPYLLAVPGYLVLNGVASMALLFFFAWFASQRELKERNKVNIRAILRRGLTGVILALLVAISFAAYESPIAAELEKSQRLPSGTERFIGVIVRSTIGPRIEDGQQKETILAEVTRETFQEFNTLLRPYFKHAPPLLAFAVFLILWGLSWFFIQLAVLVGGLIFMILSKMKFVEVQEYQIKAESLKV